MKDGTHWYRHDGSACFEVPNASKGGTRSVTINDARKLNLFPSVTTVLGILSKPSLDKWKLRQVASAALVTQPIIGESNDVFIERIINDAFKQVEDAADLGTDIHKAIELHFKGRPYDEKLRVYVEAVDKWAKKEQLTFTDHELRLVDMGAGYAGTTDAAYASPVHGHGILDFKSRKTIPGKPSAPYDGQCMQIAAYFQAHYGLYKWEGGSGCNLFISTTEPGRVDAVWYAPEQLNDEWCAFLSVLEVWRHFKDYDPRVIPA